MEFTIEKVKELILTAIEKNERFLFNELELQMLVARSLEQAFKADDGYIVHLEYRLPKGWNVDFDDAYAPWGETPYFDIVLEHKVDDNKSQYIGIELKYKLKEVKLRKEDTDFKRFGVAGQKGIKLVSNQAAENEGRYDFWKDVKRLELLTKHFNGSVIGGIAIFLTNQSSYSNTTDANYKYSAFNFSDKEGGQRLNWNHMVMSATDENSNVEIPLWCKKPKESSCQSCTSPCGEDKKKSMAAENCTEFSHFKRPNFAFERDYKIFWHGENQSLDGPLGQKFYCCYVTIPEWK